MKKQEILTKLIAHYKKVINRIDQWWWFWWHDTIKNNSVHLGICYCAGNEYHRMIYHHNWVQRHKMPGNLFWAKCPGKAKTPEEAKIQRTS
jgi:hypothetical protein